MIDRELEQGLRAFFRDEIGRDEAAPTTLRAALADRRSEGPPACSARDAAWS